MLPPLPLILLALPALALPSASSPPLVKRAPVGSPNSTIAWSLCPDTANDARETTFYCSSFKVPLNWLDPREGVNADLFLRMYPADEGKRVGSLVSPSRHHRLASVCQADLSVSSSILAPLDD